ncbi:unnamed protein product [Urochloa decumbens]|uniref:VWFA domain-containing protein n=1 Tax=Urochloa decumbens TaxID=240449 RepID=A0ABC9AS96_9POAL
MLQGEVKLHAQAGVTEIPANEGRTDLPVLVRVVAPSKQQRAPIDLVALLDTGDSMKLKAKDPHWTRMDLVVAAMELVVRRLGAADRLAIVPFNAGGNARKMTPFTYMDQVGQNNAVQFLNKPRALGGYTNFQQAFYWAVNRYLDARSGDEKATRPGFILLVSSGDDKSGIGGRHVDTGGYPVHAFEICGGQTPGKPQVMLHVARETRGTYHPVDDTVKSLALALGTFVGGITSVVAVNAKVDFAVPDGVRITKIESGSYGSEWSKGTEGHVDVGVLYGKDEKKFVVHLSVQQLTDPTKGVDKQPLLTATGTYNKPSRREPDFMKQAEVTVKRTPPPPASGTTAPPAPPATAVHIQQVVAVQIVEIHVAAVLQEVVKAHNKDDGGDAAPNPKLIAQELHDKWHSSKADEKLQHIHEDHVKTGDVHVTEMVKLLKEHGHVGVLYAHAWLASHATQQMATFAVSSVLVKHWFHSEYMALVAGDLAYHAASMAAPPAAAADDPCKCVDFDRIDHRLELWSKVKREVPEFFQPSEDAESHHLTAVIREASLDAINRAMHQDMYLVLLYYIFVYCYFIHHAASSDRHIFYYFMYMMLICLIALQGRRPCEQPQAMLLRRQAVAVVVQAAA